MDDIKKFFGVSSNYFDKSFNSFKFIIVSIKDLEKIINHFNKYSLNTEKYPDFELWKEVYYLMLSDEHLNMKGLRQIIAVKAAMNRGKLPDNKKFKKDFSNIVPVNRPIVNPTIPEENLLAGFTSAEGSFMFKIRTNKSCILGFNV